MSTPASLALLLAELARIITTLETLTDALGDTSRRDSDPSASPALVPYPPAWGACPAPDSSRGGVI